MRSIASTASSTLSILRPPRVSGRARRSPSRLGDRRRSRYTVEILPTDVGHFIACAIDDAIASLRALEPKRLDARGRALIRRVDERPSRACSFEAEAARRRATRAEREAALLAAIYAAPRDDGPRLVYADLLLQEGDRRGELIVLQCRPDAERDHAREAMVFRAYTRDWKGPLGRVIENVSFRRGFPATAVVSAAAVTEAVGHPAC